MPRAKQPCSVCGEPFRPYKEEQTRCGDCYRRGLDDVRKRKVASVLAAGEIVSNEAYTELKGALDRTLRQLSKAKASKEELVAAIYTAAKDGIQSIEIPPVPAPSEIKAGPGDEEVAIVVLSDVQLAKRTPTYNSEIAEQRVAQYAQIVKRLTNIQRSDHPVKEARVYILGDIVEGEMIFPGQAHLIDASLYRQVCVDGPRIVSNFVRTLAAYFEKVHVVGIIGNHGRIGKRGDFSPETNADRMVYTIAETILRGEPRVTWNIPSGPGERNWYAIDTVGTKRFFLFHGDQMRGGGFGGIPFYGFGRAVNGWSAGAIPGGFDYAVCGHWHQSTKLPSIGRRRLWVNGSTESYNTYAQEELKTMAEPSQQLLFAHPKRGVTWEIEVQLT
jgi:hypothetical protein